MKRRIKVISLLLVLTLVTGLSSGCSSKQSSSGGKSETPKYPTKPISMIIPVAPGGDTDTNGRILAKYLSADLGVSVQVTNVDGSSGSVGTRQVKTAKPDGYTVLFFHDATILSTMRGLLDFDIEDLTIAGIPIIDKTAVMVASAKKFKNFDEMRAKAKAGETITVSMAAGSLSQLAPVAIAQKAGMKFKYVDSTSAAGRITDLLANRIDMFFTQYGTVKQYVDSGKFSIMGLLSDERNPSFQDVPTFKEQGVDVSMDKMFYFAFPPKTPQYVVDALSKSLKTVSENQDMKNDLSKYYLKPTYKSPSDSVAYIKNLKNFYSQFHDILK